MTFSNTPIWQVRFELPDSALPLFSETLEEEFDSFSSRRNNTSCPWIIECITQQKPDRDSLKHRIAILCETCGIALPDIIIEQVPDIDWLEHVYQQFKPFEVGRFFIHGSHYRDAVPPSKIPLVIDAATAFGTGEHPTTKGCLMAIDSLVDTYRPSNCLDMGCGSGILSIAMAHCFQKPVLAVDNDPESVRVTKERIDMNHVITHVTAACGDGFNTPEVEHSKPFDLVAANILAEPLIEMAPALNDILSDGGLVILSGLLAEQEEKVCGAYTALGFKKIRDFPIDGWQAIIMKKG